MFRSKRSRYQWSWFVGCGGLALVTLAIAPAWSQVAAPRLVPSEAGRDLFLRQWEVNDPRAPEGDGLGPMFNARSCAECHHQGGLGGAGGADHDVELLCLLPPENRSRVDRSRFIAGIKQIHPTLVNADETSVFPSLTLHRRGSHPAYEKWRVALVMLGDLLPAGEVSDRISLQVHRRSTPALFGAGLIDAIPNKVLEQNARKQAKNANGIHGKVARGSDGQVGKFGWRGQTSTLRQFVFGACANELGLHVPGNDQPRDPLNLGHSPRGLDLTMEQCEQLVAFVRRLPAPPERTPANRLEEQTWLAGRQAFNRIGCGDCHPQRLGDVAGIYSDLLLHDMGPLLSDPAGSNPPGSIVVSGATPYYGGSNDVLVSTPVETQREWRTPPLWGVAATAPYLHDGRAPTLEAAILAHEGEATKVRDRYTSLSRDARDRLLAFLQSLGPMPKPAPPANIARVP